MYEVNEEGRIYKILGTGSYGGELRLGSSSGLTQIGFPVGIVGDVLGNMYVAANSVNGVIYKLSEGRAKYDYKIEYFAGVRGVYSLQGSYGKGNGGGDGLLATSTHFTYIGSIGIDFHSNIYVEDGGSKVIRKIDGVSRVTRIVVDEELYDQDDCDFRFDDDEIYEGQHFLPRIFTNNEGIFVFHCYSLRFFRSSQLTPPTTSLPRFNTMQTFIFIMVGISLLLILKRQGKLKFSSF